MPTKIEVNLQTGEVVETKLKGAELAAYEAAVLAEQNAPVETPEPSLAEVVAQLQAEIAALKAQ
jgi:hypothetical protein